MNERNYTGRLTKKETDIIFEGITNEEEYPTINPRIEKIGHRDDKTIRRAIAVASELRKLGATNLNESHFQQITEIFHETNGIVPSYVRSLYSRYRSWLGEHQLNSADPKYNLLRSSLVVERMRPRRKDEIAAALLGLYEVDKTFDYCDQYGLKLLQLILRQPDGFWVAKVNGMEVGYLSIYRMKDQNLYNSLKTDACTHKMDLPDFDDRLFGSVDSRSQRKVPKSEPIHLYIDALVVKKGYRRVKGQITSWALIRKAKEDLLELAYRTESIAVIAVQERVEGMLKRIAQTWPTFRPIGEKYQKTKKGELYRHLYIYENEHSQQM